MQIKALEGELGVMLLDRSKKPVVPTEAGEVVLAQAREALREYNSIKEVVLQFKGEIAGKIRLGVIPTIAPYILHKFIPEFVSRYPKVELEIREMHTEQLVEQMNHDQIDVSLVAGGTCGDDFTEYDLFDDRFFAYVSPSNSLYKKSNIQVSDIDMRELVLLSQGNCMRDQVLELCQSRSLYPSRYYFESGSLDTLMRIVDCTNSVTIIPEMAVEYIGKEHARQVKSLIRGAYSRKIALAVRRTYVKLSIVEALQRTILDCVKSK
jgi:LysR family hydrogen peroxide-inducible transcriptional activator